jgi:hypothetical protein
MLLLGIDLFRQDNGIEQPHRRIGMHPIYPLLASYFSRWLTSTRNDGNQGADDVRQRPFLAPCWSNRLFDRAMYIETYRLFCALAYSTIFTTNETSF